MAKQEMTKAKMVKAEFTVRYGGYKGQSPESGATPLMIESNLITCDDSHVDTKRLKAMIAERKKKGITDARKDELSKEISDLEQRTFLYLLEDDKGEQRPYVPASWVRKALSSAAKSDKLGAAVERSLRVSPPMLPVQTPGDVSVDDMIGNPHFYDRRPVRLPPRTGDLVMKTRPIIPGAVVSGVIIFDANRLDPQYIEDLFKSTCSCSGLGGGRSIEYSRCDVEKWHVTEIHQLGVSSQD